MILIIKQQSRKVLITCSLLCFLFSSLGVFAQGDLMIYPKRIVFDNTKKSQELSLSNNGTDTARYVVSVMHVRMHEDGKFETITSPDSNQRFAEQNFRFFPRTVVLAPKEAQTIKIQLVRTNELTAGEYRSHIYFRSEAKAKPLGEQDTTPDKFAISISIVPIFGISVPVIIKVGESSTQVTITGKTLNLLKETNKDATPSLDLKITRAGNMSVYGDILVEHISPSGKKVTVGLLNGVAIYAPTPARRFKIALDTTKNIDYQNGKLHITYSEQSPNKATFAETELILK
jgi:hypothetical protein